MMIAAENHGMFSLTRYPESTRDSDTIEVVERKLSQQRNLHAFPSRAKQCYSKRSGRMKAFSKSLEFFSG